MAQEKIAVVGAGPVGGVLSTYLIQGGQHVTLIDLFEEHMAAIRADGLRLEGEHPLTVQVAHSHLTLAEAAAAGARFDIIFVCVKATAVRHVAPALPPVLAEGGTVISFQNGLDTEEGLVQAIGPDQTLRGAVNYAGNYVAPGRIRKTFFNPPNHLGAARPGNEAADERARRVADILSSAKLTTEFAKDVQWHVWEKAIRNAGLMPVSALTGQNMAQVMNSAASLHLVERLLEEEVAIAAAVGYTFDPDFIPGTLEYYRKAGTHMPSMRGDVVETRQTEIEYLNHKIAEYGERHGVACPYNRALANLVLCVDEVAAEAKKK